MRRDIPNIALPNGEEVDCQVNQRGFFQVLRPILCVVKEKILQTRPHALSQSKFSSSKRTVMTSAMASDGWVSFNCRAT